MRRRHHRTTGFSVVEVLIAATILLIIAIGIVPLLTQAAVSNLSGNDSTKVANMARDRAEEIVQLDFNSTQLTIDAGNEKLLPDPYQYYSLRDEVWKDGPIPLDGSDPGLFTRVTTIRQYAVGALEDEKLETSEALPAGADPSLIHLKEIEVEIRGVRSLGSPLGPAKRISIRLLKVA